MANWLIVAAVWIIAMVCYRIMKKIQPELSKLYLIYVIVICVLFTGVAIVRLSAI